MTAAPCVTETRYALNAANLGPFNTVFPYAADTDVKVAVDYNDGAGQQAQAIDVGYSLADIVPTLTNGGQVTLSNTLLLGQVAWPANAYLVISRGTPVGQPSSFGEALTYSPQAAEQALDNVERQVQELSTRLARMLAFPPGEAGVVLADADLRKGLAIVFDPVTGALALAALPQGGAAWAPSILAAPPAMPTSWLIYIDEALGPRIFDPRDNAWHGLAEG